MEKIYHAKEFWVKKEYCLRTRKPLEKSVFFFVGYIKKETRKLVQKINV